MRLQTLLPPYPKKIEVRDILGKDEVFRYISNKFMFTRGNNTGCSGKKEPGKSTFVPK